MLLIRKNGIENINIFNGTEDQLKEWFGGFYIPVSADPLTLESLDRRIKVIESRLAIL